MAKHYFKYRCLSNLRYFLDILVYKRLYMASYTELNDPMEGAFFVEGNKQGLDHHALDLLRSEKNEMRICSLSKKYNNILMWAHYADSNKGCCIECEVTSSINIEEVKVAYLPHIEPIERYDPEETARLVLSRKLECWSYEDEVRFLKKVPLGSRRTGYLSIKIHKIYLGMKVSEKEQRFYTKLIQSIDKSIEVVKMKKEDLEY